MNDIKNIQNFEEEEKITKGLEAFLPCKRVLESFVFKKAGHAFSHTQQKFIYLMANVHGDEIEAYHLFWRFFFWFRNVVENPDNKINNEERKKILRYSFVFIPTLNPYGLENSLRENAFGVDLNRNYPSSGWIRSKSKGPFYSGEKPLSELENQFLVKNFSLFPPLFIVSLHSWKPILNYNGKNLLALCEDLALINNYPVTDDISYPTPGSLGEYAPEKFDAEVLTYELPKKADCNFYSMIELNFKTLQNMIQGKSIENYLSLKFKI